MSLDSKNTIDYDVLAKYFADNASPQEVETITAWREISATNESEYQELYLVWIDTGIFRKEPAKLSVNVDAAWNKLSGRLEDTTKVISINKPVRNWQPLLKYAAILVIALGSYFVFDMLSGDVNILKLEASTEVKTQELVDGSVIKLNTNSTLTYPKEFGKENRKVKLEGEAFFEVEPDATKPFIIEVGEAQVKVLGTSFNVNGHSADNEVSVFVETGKVMLSYKGNEEILTKGMSGILNKTTGAITVVYDADENVDAWRDHKLIFKNAKLSKVIKILNEYYNSNIILGSEAVGNCKLTAHFDDDTFENILDIIISTFNLEKTEVNNQITLDGDGC